MATPVQSAEVGNLIKMLAGGGPGGASPGGPPPGGPPPPPGAGGAPASPQAAAVNSGLTQLDGANPQGLVDSLRAMNNDLAKVYLMAAMRMPNIPPHIAKARESLEKAISEAQKASQTLQSVAPIMNSAGIGPAATARQGQPDVAALLG